MHGAVGMAQRLLCTSAACTRHYLPAVQTEECETNVQSCRFARIQKKKQQQESERILPQREIYILSAVSFSFPQRVSGSKPD